MAELTLNEQLTRVSEELQDQTTTRIVCDKLIEAGTIRIVDNSPQAEGKEPMTIAVSGDIVERVLRPVIDLVNAKRERALNQKEQLLAQIEKQTVK